MVTGAAGVCAGTKEGIAKAVVSVHAIGGEGCVGCFVGGEGQELLEGGIPVVTVFPTVEESTEGVVIVLVAVTVAGSLLGLRGAPVAAVVALMCVVLLVLVGSRSRGVGRQRVDVEEVGPWKEGLTADGCDQLVEVHGWHAGLLLKVLPGAVVCEVFGDGIVDVRQNVWDKLWAVAEVSGFFQCCVHLANLLGNGAGG